MRRTLLFLVLACLSSASLADVCDKNEIFKLMVETGYLDMKDESFCVELNEFPNVRLKMKEGKHDLGKPRELTDRMAKQDGDIKKLVDLLNSTSSESNGQKFQVNARGFADGTFNDQKNLDEEIVKSIGVINQNKSYDIDPQKLKNVIGAMDAKGSEAILAEIERINLAKKVDPNRPVPWESIKDDSRLKSMIRNSFLAKSRGDKLCSDIFGSNNYCRSSGEISPLLDTGEHCFAGCCDERRGNIIDIIAPQKDAMSVGGTGTYKPPFKSPSRSLQGKLQMAASLSVFDLKLDPAEGLEKDILLNGKFDENLEKDRERFRKAFANTGCEKNDFAIDSARRIYWAVKSMKDFVSPELYQAAMKGDFATVYKFYESPTVEAKFNVPNKNLLSVLFSGGNNNLAKVQGNSSCPKTRAEDADWANHSSYKTCKISPNSSPEVFELLKKSDRKGRVTTNDNLYELSKLTTAKESEGQDFYVIQDTTTKNNYYLYDRKANKPYYFTFDHTSDDCSALGPGYNYKPKANAKRIDAQLSPACLQIITNSQSKIPPSFTAQAPKIGTVVPSDPLNCLDASKGLENELRDMNPQGEATISMEAGNYQKPLCKLQNAGSLNVAINPKELMVIDGAAKGKQGFMCTGCSSGIAFDAKSKKFNYISRQENRPVGEEAGGQKELARRTWSEAKGNPMSLASLKHLKTYIIPNCGPSCENACECLRDGNLKEKLTESNTTAMDFTDLSLGNSKSVISSDPKSAKDLVPGKRQFSCVFTPPVPHTCSYNPLGDTPTELKSDDHFSEVCPITEALKKLPKVNTETVSEENIRLYKERCQKDSFPSTEANCQSVRGGPMCSKKRAKNSCQEPSYKPSPGSGSSKTKAQ